MKIFPVIAKVIVFKKVAEQLWTNYVQVTEELANENLDGLASLHAISCCLKAVCTNEMTQAVQNLRLACGGHGFLNSAGFSDIFKFVTAAQTYEGENTVLLLQTARYLLKSWSQALNGKPLAASVRYLKNYAQGNVRQPWDRSLEGILGAFEAATAGRLSLAFKHLQKRAESCSIEEATNLTGNELTKVAEMHCHLYLLQTALTSFNAAVKSASPALGEVLRHILELYFLDATIKSIGILVQVP